MDSRHGSGTSMMVGSQPGPPFGPNAGMPMHPMPGYPGRMDMAGPAGGQAGVHHPSPYAVPHVLVPATALQYLPGYAQQVVPQQGMHGPGGQYPHMAHPYGSPPHFQVSQASRGSGRSSGPQHRSDWQHGSQGTPSSPEGTNSAVDALTDSMHSVSFSSPDAKVGARTAGGRRKGKKPCPEDLEEARHRTIYVSDLNKGITETELVRWFGVAGHVLECRICSDMNTSKRFAFVEFADKEGFDQGLAMSGQKLNSSVIKVSPSKTPIVPINRDFMPRDEKELERCERTVYVNQIDRAVPGSAVEAMFESFCGDIEHVKMKLDKQHNTRIAFIEFKTNDAAKSALSMCGTLLGSSQIRVSPSKTPVRVQTA